MTTTRSVIVGTKFKGRQAMDVADQMRPGDEVRLVRENHPKDRNAIQCHYGGIQVGYIPRQVNAPIAAAMDAGFRVTAIVESPSQWRGRTKSEPVVLIDVDAST